MFGIGQRSVTVTDVVDGDTFEIAGGERVRVLGNDDDGPRTCTDVTTTTSEPAPSSDDDDRDCRYVPAPSYTGDEDGGGTRRHTGNSGHPCLPGERDGDHDGYCGEGR